MLSDKYKKNMWDFFRTCKKKKIDLFPPILYRVLLNWISILYPWHHLDPSRRETIGGEIQRNIRRGNCWAVNWLRTNFFNATNRANLLINHQEGNILITYFCHFWILLNPIDQPSNPWFVTATILKFRCPPGWPLRYRASGSRQIMIGHESENRSSERRGEKTLETSIMPLFHREKSDLLTCNRSRANYAPLQGCMHLLLSREKGMLL